MKLCFVWLLFLTLISLSLAQEDVVYEEDFVEIEEVPIPVEPLIEQPQEQIPASSTFPREPIKLDLATLQRFKNEVLGLCLIFVYLIVFVRGKKTNLQLMERFYRKVDRYLENSFAHIGFSRVSGEVPFNGQSASQTTFYASGRENVDYIQMRFNTKKRQDLLYRLYDMFFPEKDTVTIDLPLKTDIPLVFLVAGKKKTKEMKENSLDIKKLTMQFNINQLINTYEVQGESIETVDALIDNNIVKKLNDMKGLVEAIHYTDQKFYSENQGHLRVVLNISHKNSELFLPALELTFQLVDKISSYKLPVNAKAKSLKAREAYNQSKEKEDLQKHNEQLRKKKEDKKRQEDAWIRSLPPEKQKREEEKRKRKEFNKMMKGKTMKI